MWTPSSPFRHISIIYFISDWFFFLEIIITSFFLFFLFDCEFPESFFFYSTFKLNKRGSCYFDFNFKVLNALLLSVIVLFIFCPWNPLHSWCFIMCWFGMIIWETITTLLLCNAQTRNTTHINDVNNCITQGVTSAGLIVRCWTLNSILIVYTSLVFYAVFLLPFTVLIRP